WVFTAVLTLLVSIWFSLLRHVTEAIGAISPVSTLFFFGLLFCLVLLLHFSVRISSLERRLTALVQEVGMMSVEEPDRATAAPRGGRGAGAGGRGGRGAQGGARQGRGLARRLPGGPPGAPPPPPPPRRSRAHPPSGRTPAACGG